MLISKANRNEVYKYLFKGNTCYAISLSSLALKWICLLYTSDAADD